MRVIKKLIIFAFIAFFIAGQSALCKTIKKDIMVQTKDAHIIKATLTYNQSSKQKYPTVLLLHSLGYTSKNWGNLISYLNKAGYAVIAMDLRGHGKSVYDSKLHEHSWVYFKPKAYQRFPSDVVDILNQAQKTSKKVSVNNYAIIGADIGANTAILAARQFKYKPKAMALISPSINFKGLYVPIKLTEIGTVPVLAMACTQDRYSMGQERTIARFAQGAFFVKNYPKGGMGMMMLKVNPSMSYDITKWIARYLH